MIYKKSTKRIADLIVALSALIALAPLICLITVLIKLTSAGPVFFRQVRLGEHGLPFTMIKFRTMQPGAPVIQNSDGSAFVGQNDQRLTKIGRFLREYTLDEIPQLVNVMKGELSIVGPRPDMIEQLSSYSEWMKRRLEIKPGMACLPMVYGRNSLTRHSRVELDIYYIEHQSLKFDVMIFVQCFFQLLLRKGVYYPEDYNRRAQDTRNLNTALKKSNR